MTMIMIRALDRTTDENCIRRDDRIEIDTMTFLRPTSIVLELKIKNQTRQINHHV